MTLADERAQAEAARVRLKVRDYTGGSAFDKLAGDVDYEVVLLNTSFVATPEQSKEDKSQPPAGRVARVHDRDMTSFLQSLEEIGFFRYAQPTGAVASLFGSENARGRITVERDGVSVTLLAEVFNVFNWKNYGNYNTQLDSASFGLPVASSGNAYVARSGQLGFRLEF